MRIISIVCVLIIGCSSLNHLHLKKQDTIIFLGDSITQLGVEPDGFIDIISRTIDREYPDLNITVIGAGISGHRVPDCQKRLETDVLKKNPTIVLIYIGINDVWHWKRGEGTTKENFESGLIDMINQIIKAGARVILCTPTVIGEKIDGTNHFDKMLDEYSVISRKIAKKTGSIMLDLRVEFKTYLKQHNKNNTEQGILTRDAVHLNQNGNNILANLILDALNVPHAEVFQNQ